MPRYIPQHIKTQVAVRDKGRCTRCGNKGSLRKPLQFHHVIPWHISKSHAPGNIVLLCERCHLFMHRGRQIAA